MRPAAIALVGLAALAAFAVLAHSQASSSSSSNTDAELEAFPTYDAPAFPWDRLDGWGLVVAQLESSAVERAVTDPHVFTQLEAFLSMIAKAEGTDRAADPYRVCYGYRHTVSDMTDHPAITGEWQGESIASLGPQYVGKISTAAGRYQIIKPTWQACKTALGLVDFSPRSQDLAATYLVKKRGAFDDVQTGNIVDAIAKCRNEWASLPGGDAGQPQRRLEALLEAFTDAGGYLA